MSSQKQQVKRFRLPALHPRQAEFVNCDARIVCAACGTKTGKTFGMSMWLLKEAWNNYQSINWWTAPTYRQANIAFRLIGSILPPGTFKRHASAGAMAYELLRSDGSVHSTIEFRSADNPESLRGEGVSACVIDEAGYWSHASFVSVWTTLTRTRGKLRIISTPKGRSWFYDEWLKGWDADLRKKHPEYRSFTLPTSSNPFVPRESILEAKKNLPEDVFRQEFMAEFLDESAGVFRGIRDAMQAQWLEAPLQGRQYVMGVDWAKRADYTVFTLADRHTKEIVHIKRHNQIDWNSNIDMAVRTAKTWNKAQIVMDSTGVGDVPFDAIRAVYPHCVGYSISTNAAKQALIQKMQLALEQKTITLPSATSTKRPEPKILQKELEMYSFEISATGKIQYAAPEGYYDDCVISACLANWPLNDAPYVYRAKSIRGV